MLVYLLGFLLLPLGSSLDLITECHLIFVHLSPCFVQLVQLRDQQTFLKGLHHKCLQCAGRMVYVAIIQLYYGTHRQRETKCKPMGITVHQYIFMGHCLITPGLVYNLCLYCLIFHSLTPISSSLIPFPYIAESKATCLDIKSWDRTLIITGYNNRT